MPFLKEVSLLQQLKLVRKILPGITRLTPAAHSLMPKANLTYHNVSPVLFRHNVDYKKIFVRNLSTNNKTPWEMITPKGDLNDIGGYEDVKDLEDFIEYFDNPRKWKNYGLKTPKGAIFIGPSGTGKSDFAEKLAGHAGVSFVRVNATHLFDPYLGGTEQKIAQLFQEISKFGKLVLCIEEIDALARTRGDGNLSSDNIVSALLHELERDHEGIIIIGISNNDNLDPAITRPGRFDKVITFSIPEQAERVAILKVLTRDLKLKNIDLNKMAQIITGFTGARIDSWVNEVKKIAMHRQSKFITEQHFMEAFVNIIHGSGKKHLDPTSEYQVAVHEAGHTLVGYLLGIKVLYVSILRTPNGSGINRILIPEDVQFTKDYLLRLNCMLLAGRAAEAEFGIVQAGSQDDLDKVRMNLLHLTQKEGMGSDILGYKSEEDTYKYANWLYKKTRDIIKSHTDVLLRLVNALMKHKLIYGEDIAKVINGKEPDNIYVYSPNLPKSRLSIKAEEKTQGSLTKYGVFTNKPKPRKGEKFIIAAEIVAKLLKIEGDTIEEFRENSGNLEILISNTQDYDEFFELNKHFEEGILPDLKDGIDAYYIRCQGILGGSMLVINADSRAKFTQLAFNEFNKDSGTDNKPGL